MADDGPGMTPQERSRAFLRFTTGSQNGTGLGLAIVHRLVTANGGGIRLADTPGGGLTVEVELPSQDDPPGGQARTITRGERPGLCAGDPLAAPPLPPGEP